EQGHNQPRSGADRHYVRGPAGHVGTRIAPTHGAIHPCPPIAGGDAQRPDLRPDRLQKLHAELTQALDHNRRRHLVDPLHLRSIRAQQLGQAEMRRELDILNCADPLAVLTYHLPPPARGAEHQSTVHIADHRTPRMRRSEMWPSMYCEMSPTLSP